jgi:hypothetical protein
MLISVVPTPLISQTARSIQSNCWVLILITDAQRRQAIENRLTACECAFDSALSTLAD